MGRLQAQPGRGVKQTYGQLIGVVDFGYRVAIGVPVSCGNQNQHHQLDVLLPTFLGFGCGKANRSQYLFVLGFACRGAECVFVDIHLLAILVWVVGGGKGEIMDFFVLFVSGLACHRVDCGFSTSTCWQSLLGLSGVVKGETPANCVIRLGLRLSRG